MSSVERLTDFRVLAPAAGTAQVSPALACGRSSGLVYCPAGLVSTSLKWQASPDGVNFATLADGAGGDVATTVAASKCVPLPAQWPACAAFKVIPQGNETGCQLIISLKA